MLFGLGKLGLALSFLAIGLSNPVVDRSGGGLPESFTNSLKGIGKYLSEIDDMILAFPKAGATFDQAQALRAKMDGVVDLERAFHDLDDALPKYVVTPEDNTEIENILMSYVPTAQSLTTNIIPLRPSFEAVNIPPQVVRDDIFAVALYVGYYLSWKLEAQTGDFGVQGVSKATVDKFQKAFGPLFNKPGDAYW